MASLSRAPQQMIENDLARSALSRIFLQNVYQNIFIGMWHTRHVGLGGTFGRLFMRWTALLKAAVLPAPVVKHACGVQSVCWVDSVVANSCSTADRGPCDCVPAATRTMLSEEIQSIGCSQDASVSGRAALLAYVYRTGDASSTTASHIGAI